MVNTSSGISVMGYRNDEFHTRYLVFVVVVDPRTVLKSGVGSGYLSLRCKCSKSTLRARTISNCSRHGTLVNN